MNEKIVVKPEDWQNQDRRPGDENFLGRIKISKRDMASPENKITISSEELDKSQQPLDATIVMHSEDLPPPSTAIKINPEDVAPSVLTISLEELKSNFFATQTEIEKQISLIKDDVNYWKNTRLMKGYKYLRESVARMQLAERIYALLPKTKDLIDEAKVMEAGLRLAQQNNGVIMPYLETYRREQASCLNETYRGKTFSVPGMEGHKLQTYTGQEKDGGAIWSCVAASTYNALKRLGALLPGETEDDLIRATGVKNLFGTGGGSNPLDFVGVFLSRGLPVNYTDNVIEIVESLRKGNVAMFTDEKAWHCVLVSGIELDKRHNFKVFANDPLESKPKAIPIEELIGNLLPMPDRNMGLRNFYLVEKNVLEIKVS